MYFGSIWIILFLFYFEQLQAYCEGFGVAVETLDATRQSNAKFAKFLASIYDANAKARQQWVDLAALLALPLNRLTRYESLLTKIAADSPHV